MYTTDVFNFSYLRKSPSKRCILHYSHTSELSVKFNLDFNVDSRVFFHNFVTLQKSHKNLFYYNFSTFLNVYTNTIHK